MHRILSNPFYIGINHFDGKDYPGAQEPIISKVLFDKVQQKLKRKSGTKYHKHYPLLGGLIRCDSCNGIVTWQLQKGRYYGTCQRTLAECKAYGMLREDRVETVIIKKLRRLSDPEGRWLRKVKVALDAIRPEYVGAYRERVITAINAQLIRLHRLDDKLYEDKLLGNISEERYEEKHSAFMEQESDAKERLARMLDAQDTQGETIRESDETVPLVRLYLMSPIEQKRVVMGSLFKKMTAKHGGVLIRLDQES